MPNRQIAIINGPNLNLLGKREPDLYGTTSMEAVLYALQREFPQQTFFYRQSNHEGDLIDWIQAITLAPAGDYSGIILNAGGYTHTSISIRDAIVCCPLPTVEVHITDICAREDFRRTDLLANVCAHSIIGKGVNGYKMAVEWLLQHQNT